MNPSWNRICFYMLFNILWCFLHAQHDVGINGTASTLRKNLNNISEPNEDDIIREVFFKDSLISISNDSLNETSRKINNIQENMINIFFNQLLVPVNNETHLKSKSMLRYIATLCITPDNEKGYCKPLKTCSHLMNQLFDKSAYEFLRNSRCGPKNEMISNPYVCCGEHDHYHNELEKEEPEVCGRQAVTLHARILGGKKASLGEFPWMARLFHKHRYTHAKVFGCSGFLITSNFVLTAAHCLESDNVPILGPITEVQLGEHNTETERDCNSKHTKCAPKPQVRHIKKRIVHPNYNMTSVNHHNDIGLIQLKKPVNFTDYVFPICLLDKLDFEPFEYWISGWGKTKNKQESSVKMKLSVSPFPHLNCSDRYKSIHIEVNSNQICAGGKKNKDSCTGDSGGPLMLVNNSSHWFAAGVVSYGLGCGQEGWPGVYTNVTSYLEWIQTTIRKKNT